MARAGELQQETRRRIEVLEEHLRRETEALSARMDRELHEHAAALRAMSREQREAIDTLEHRVSQAEEAVVRAQHGLRQELLEQAKTFLDEQHRLRRDLFTMLERELGLAEGELEEETRGDAATTRLSS
jgi:hypothetical protein